MRFRDCIPISLILISGSAYANTGSFSYHGQAVSPKCIASLLENADESDPPSSSVSLSECSAANITYHNEEGSYTTKDPSTKALKPFAEYQVIGSDGDKHLLSFSEWTGGSGIFTNVVWIKQDGDQLKLLNVLTAGDRCNGGSSMAGPWEYAVNLTPPDLLSFTSAKKPPRIKAYKDLDSSAVACVAKAYYKFDPKTAKPSLEYIKLNEEKPDNDSDWVTRFTYQVCFNKLTSSYVEKDEVKLDQKQIDAFVKDFRKECMKDKEDPLVNLDRINDKKE